jgi:hypothetical protein
LEAPLERVCSGRAAGLGHRGRHRFRPARQRRRRGVRYQDLARLPAWARTTPPETGSVTEKTAAWPNDPDVKRAKEIRAARKKPAKTVEDEWFPELPDQLGPRAKTAPPGQIPTAGPPKDGTAPSTWTELGAKSIFTLGGLIGSKEEYATFDREPPRTSLTEPPAGYRTPSPIQPYGLGKQRIERGVAANPMDHAGSNTGLPR